MSLAKQIFDAAFARPRDARSDAYKAGVLACLRRRTGEETGDLVVLYAEGTAERDAFFAGVEEGWVRWDQWDDGRGAA